jgi:aldehyde dehydrogenase (NAD+)
MKTDINAILKQLGIQEINAAYSTGNDWGGLDNVKTIESFSPVDGKKIAAVKVATQADYDTILNKAQKAFEDWRTVPARKYSSVWRGFTSK